MRTLVLALVGASVIAMGAVSAADSATSEGVHGAGVSVQTPEFGTPGVQRLVVNVNRLPSGDLVGEVVFTVSGFGRTDVARIWAKPVFLLTSSDAACVVAEVDRSQPDNPSDFIVVHVQDFPGVLDLYQVAVFFPGNPLDQCALIGPGPDPQQLTQGNFTIFH
jgi:hypothetical protein